MITGMRFAGGAPARKPVRFGGREFTPDELQQAVQQLHRERERETREIERIAKTLESYLKLNGLGYQVSYAPSHTDGRGRPSEDVTKSHDYYIEVLYNDDYSPQPILERLREVLPIFEILDSQVEWRHRADPVTQGRLRIDISGFPELADIKQKTYVFRMRALETLEGW